ncbi:hypothetical protein BIFLAC_02112 [Bifidobacterium animalis subsp. lactis HN019]|jgi:hypothetical protein|nr:hypothetical protein Balac_1062 [Bifidobacterium animalis subsp. lactis Bl-04]ACS47987.1 hypothetical protein Balat_1062 [Bifidobacterium animalis subsp. lactis DSM 10140]ADG33612.1 hypothetical protein BalV_1024 [Bifidobacterium animalis subsp. lactis V9]AGW85257.1 hypothetical protein BLAC_05360 [Bifidobacterium animalis subsp. lactis ATCC 27673]EDT89659.1 hypothetical protein BIFLAC_02112 [Bifidobacterium animalis subsp. lactis HN019]EHN17762.1 hypothetical protein FEM_13546 [Bifidobacte
MTYAMHMVNSFSGEIPHAWACGISRLSVPPSMGANRSPMDGSARMMQDINEMT